jgi:hypothetical protein
VSEKGDRVSQYNDMRFSIASLALGALGLITAQSSLDDIDFREFTPSTTLKSTGLTDSVQWDGYSLFVNKERALIFSGEIHRESL